MLGFRRVFVVSLTLLWAVFAYAQANTIDTWQLPFEQHIANIAKAPNKVLHELQNTPPGAQHNALFKAQYHAVLSQVYYALSFPALAVEHAKSSLSYVDSQQQPWLYHTVKLNEAQALDIVGQPNAGLQGANAAIVWAQLNKDKVLLTAGFYVRGELRNSLLDYHGALQDLQQAYDLAPRQGSNLSKGNVAGMLALVYEYRREDKLAIPFFQEAVDYNRRTDHALELSIALYGLGRALKNTGNIEQGKAMLLESKQVAQSVKDEQGVAYALKELAGIELQAKRFEHAQSLLVEALQIFNKSQNRYMLLDTYRSMAVLSMKIAEPMLAKKYLDAAYNALAPDMMRIQKLGLDEVKASYLAEIGDYQQAYQLLESIQEPRRRHLNMKSTQQLHTLRSQYEIDVKDRENELLEHRNRLQQANLSAAQTQNLQLTLLFGATLLICLLLMILAYRTKKNRAQLEALANTDGLTGLVNRRYGLELLEQQLVLASRYDFALSAAIVDIDWFKKINDQYGHAVGDDVLEAFGQCCQSMFRSSDIVGRIGGEEFVIVLPHTNLKDAHNTLKTLSLKIKEIPAQMGIEGLSLSISCGLCRYQPGWTSEELMLRCDKALYQAKHAGRDQIHTG